MLEPFTLTTIASFGMASGGPDVAGLVAEVSGRRQGTAR
jgi:hypothetical protein